MASSNAIKAGEAYIRLFGDDSALRAALKGAEKKLRAFGTAVASIGVGLAAVGTGTLTGLFAASKAFSDVGDAIDKMNIRTGLSTEFISEVGFAAEQSGSNIEELEKGFRKYQQTLGDAVQGNKEAADAFRTVGLSVSALLKMSPDEQFYAIAKAISGVANEAKRTEAAMALLGRGGAQLIPLFMEGAAGIDALRRQARKLGLTFTAEDAKAAALLNDALNALSRSVKALWVWIGSALAPVFTQLADALTTIVSATSEWVRQNQGLVVMVAAAAAGVTALGAAIIVVGGAFVALGLAAGGLSVVIGILTSWPALVVGIGAAFLYVTDQVGAARQAIGTALAWLADRFQDVKVIAMDSFAGIADAISTGDIQLAGEILWAGLIATWKSGTASLKEIWGKVKTAVLTTAYELWAGIQIVWDGIAEGLFSVMVNTWYDLRNAWTNFTAFIKKTWTDVTGWVADQFLEIQGLFDSSFDVEAAKQIRRDNDERTKKGVDADRDKAIREHEDNRKNLDAAAQSRIQDKQKRVADELAEAERKLAAANEKSKAEAQAEVDLAKAKLAQLVAEAAMRRRIAEEGKKHLQIADKVHASAAGFNTSIATKVSGNFDLRALAAQVAGPEKAADETAKNTKDLVRVGENILRRLQYTGALAFF